MDTVPIRPSVRLTCIKQINAGVLLIYVLQIIIYYNIYKHINNVNYHVNTDQYQYNWSN